MYLWVCVCVCVCVCMCVCVRECIQYNSDIDMYTCMYNNTHKYIYLCTPIIS